MKRAWFFLALVAILGACKNSEVKSPVEESAVANPSASIEKEGGPKFRYGVSPEKMTWPLAEIFCKAHFPRGAHVPSARELARLCVAKWGCELEETQFPEQDYSDYEIQQERKRMENRGFLPVYLRPKGGREVHSTGRNRVLTDFYINPDKVNIPAKDGGGQYWTSTISAMPKHGFRKEKKGREVPASGFNPYNFQNGKMDASWSSGYDFGVICFY